VDKDAVPVRAGAVADAQELSTGPAQGRPPPTARTTAGSATRRQRALGSHTGHDRAQRPTDQQRATSHARQRDGDLTAHRVLKVGGKGGKTVLVPLPPAVARAVERAAGDRAGGPLLLNRNGARMDRHAASRRLRLVAASSRMRMPHLHPHMLRHTFVTTMLDAGVDLRDVQIAARHADPRTTMRYDRARNQLDRHPNYVLAAYMASGT
jgi:hypothetical protein